MKKIKFENVVIILIIIATIALCLLPKSIIYLCAWEITMLVGIISLLVKFNAKEKLS